MRTFIPALGLALVLAGCGQSSNDGQSADQQGGDKASKATASDGADSGQTAGSDFDSKAAKRSYALGMDIGKSLSDVPMDLSMEQLTQGIKDTVEGGEPRLSQKQLRSTMQSMMTEMQAQQEQQSKADAEDNAKAGKQFRQKNKSKDSVKVTDSGLQYKVLKEGEGASPTSGDRVKVHYEGRLIDGTVFDSSRENGEPVTFPVDAVIPGWTEALQLMKEGARYKLVIPPELAYGERGAGAKIGPSETLVFNVELLEVKQGKADKQSGGDASGSGQSGKGGDAAASDSAE